MQQLVTVAFLRLQQHCDGLSQQQQQQQQQQREQQREQQQRNEQVWQQLQAHYQPMAMNANSCQAAPQTCTVGTQQLLVHLHGPADKSQACTALQVSPVTHGFSHPVGGACSMPQSSRRTQNSLTTTSSNATPLPGGCVPCVRTVVETHCQVSGAHPGLPATAAKKPSSTEPAESAATKIDSHPKQSKINMGLTQKECTTKLQLVKKAWTEAPDLAGSGPLHLLHQQYRVLHDHFSTKSSADGKSKMDHLCIHQKQLCS